MQISDVWAASTKQSKKPLSMKDLLQNDVRYEAYKERDKLLEQLSLKNYYYFT